jgi:hypothetical protein
LERGVSVSQAESGTQIGNNRIVPRYPFEARFKIRIERPGEILEIEGWARDLSESGLGAFVATPIMVGEQAVLRIPLANGSELVIPCIVARNVGTQYGFQFTALSKEQRRHILRVIAGKKAIPFNPVSV